MYQVYQTAKQSGFSVVKKPIENLDKTPDITISIDRYRSFQTMAGFGGAFTEAATYTLSQMSSEKREAVLQAYFNKDTGLGYTLGRVSIHSCDFSLENYTYVEDDDRHLDTFNIERDFKWVIPMIQDAERIAGEPIQLLASPWSPPAWMKTNNDMNHGGKLKPEYYQAWANYYVKFIDAYKEAGLNIFAVSVQNEPAAVQVWDSCIYTAEEERDFVKHYLGPTLKKHHPDIHIIIWDHNRDILVKRGDTVLKDKETREYVWGTGIHWYVSEAFENLTTLHQLHPDKHLLFTEGCIEGGVHLGAWHTGERYARNMIGDFNNYCEGYIDWNLTLNEIGGPNHVGNYCDAPIICDTTTDETIYESSYYYISHFSRNILPGAKRTQSTGTSDVIKHVSFIHENKEEVVILLNESEQAYTVNVAFNDDIVQIESAARSITTVKKKGE